MRRRDLASVPVWCDRVLDGTIVLLAAWTIAYHVCLLARAGVGGAAGLTGVALVGWVVLHRRLDGPGDPGPVPGHVPGPGWRDAAADGSPAAYLRSRWAVVTVVAAVVAAVGMAVSAPWPLVWIPWLVAAGAGTGWAVAHLRATPDEPEPDQPDQPDEPDEPGSSPWTSVVVLAWAVAMAALAAWSLKPSPDDLFYVNVSQWVAAHGSFPLRDTVFSDLTYPMANWPPVASYDGLVGALAHATSTRAGAVEYLVVPPIASFLAVLALWRMLRAWRVGHLGVVLSVALLFLLFDGDVSYGTPGGLFATRLWQGKIILLCVVVPVLLTMAVRYVEQPSKRGLLWLATGGVAAVALSTTAIFLVPVIAVAGAAPLVRRSWRQALAGFAALAAYPLGAGIVTKALGGRSADDFGARRGYRFDGSWIGHEIFLTGFLAVLAVAAVLLGALLVPHRAARVTTGLLALAAGLPLVPGVTRAAYDVVGLGPTLWRLSWGCTVAALVGLAVVRLAALVPGPRVATVGGAAALSLLLLATLGTPIWSESLGARLEAPFHWQRSYSSRSVGDHLIAAVRPGRLILAPDPVSITVAVTTTSEKTVAPRDYYMYYLRDDPRFHYHERLKLVRFSNSEGQWSQAELDRDLDVVGVDVACVARWDTARAAGLRRAGLVPLLQSTYYTCLHRP